MNKFLLFNLLFLLTISLQAQEALYGVRLGVNFSSINADKLPTDVQDGRIGPIAGFLAEIPIKGKISIQPELQYSAEGNKENKVRVDYLQLPIFLKYNFTNRFNVHVGPQIGLKIWQWEENKAPDPEDPTDYQFNFNTFNYSLMGGLGVNITENIFVDLRYAIGLSNTFDEDKSFTTDEGKTGNFQLTVGYRL